jgi:hypothetical protein
MKPKRKTHAVIRKAKPKSDLVKPKRKETTPMSRPKNETYGDEPADEPIPGPDQGEQTPLVEPPPDHDAHPIEAALEAADTAVRKTQGGPPGSGVKALLAVVAAQIGVKLT